MADDGVIGSNGAIPWRISDDMRRFKALTMGKPVIMGRKTWQSLPKRPLPGRLNIVITRDATFAAEGATKVSSLDEGLVRAARENPSEIMVIGGAEIYRAALPKAVRIHLTEVHGEFQGDTSMDKFSPEQWRETLREDHMSTDGLRYSYVTLERR
jgi:dihydrofolate reductase